MILKSIAIAMTVAFSTQAHATIDKFFRVGPGVYRGAQPTTVQDYEQLKQLGIKTIINLRHDGKSEAAVAKRMGFGFHFAPMTAWSYPEDSQIAETLAAIDNPRNQPVFVHCEFGKDRTGLIIALYRVHHQGWDQEAAYEEMLSFGFNRIFVGLLTYYFKNTLDQLDNLIHRADRVASGN